jgi:hypothetical protein
LPREIHGREDRRVDLLHHTGGTHPWNRSPSRTQVDERKGMDLPGNRGEGLGERKDSVVDSPVYTPDASSCHGPVGPGGGLILGIIACMVRKYYNEKL